MEEDGGEGGLALVGAVTEAVVDRTSALLWLAVANVLRPLMVASVEPLDDCAIALLDTGALDEITLLEADWPELIADSTTVVLWPLTEEAEGTGPETPAEEAALERGPMTPEEVGILELKKTGPVLRLASDSADDESIAELEGASIPEEKIAELALV